MIRFLPMSIFEEKKIYLFALPRFILVVLWCNEFQSKGYKFGLYMNDFILSWDQLVRKSSFCSPPCPTVPSLFSSWLAPLILLESCWSLLNIYVYKYLHRNLCFYLFQDVECIHIFFVIGKVFSFLTCLVHCKPSHIPRVR